MLRASTSSKVASLLSEEKNTKCPVFLCAIHGNLRELNELNAPRKLSRFTQQDLWRRTLHCVLFSWMRDINEALSAWTALGSFAVFPLAFLVHLAATQWFLFWTSFRQWTFHLNHLYTCASRHEYTSFLIILA
jgi:hypothetical protein